MTLAELLCSAYVALALPNADTACMNMDTVIESSYKHNVDATIITALIFYESRWKPKAISSSRACGLTQVLPKYTRKPRRTCKELLDPKVSINTGAKTLGQWQHGRYAKGRVKIALCAYSKGYRCYGEDAHQGAHRYARNIIRLSKRLKKKMLKVQDDHARGIDVPGCYDDDRADATGHYD